MKRQQDIEDALRWIVEFMDEHPAWTEKYFTEHGGAKSETEWLKSARRLLHQRAKAAHSKESEDE